MNVITTSSTGPLPRIQALFNTVVAFLARFSMAAVFWKSGQTKVEGFALDIVSGEFRLNGVH